MKAVVTASLFTLALAAPFDLLPRVLPDHTPVNIPNFDDFDAICSAYYSGILLLALNYF